MQQPAEKQEGGAATLVVCIGNALAGDDGAGPAVYARLAGQSLPRSVRLLSLGIGGIELLDHLQGEERLIVVDAVQLGGVPGTVHQLEWERLPVRNLRPVSGHGIGIREAIEVGRRLDPGKMPGEIVLVGIEGKCFDQLGERLTAEVSAAVPRAVREVLQLLAG